MIPLEIRDLIDTTVHEAIQAVYGHLPDGLESRCAIYAIVGAGCLRTLTHQPYQPVGGTQWVDLADGTRHAICPDSDQLQAASHLHQVRNYHCWIECNSHQGRELVDFTVRHHQAACQLLGLAPALLLEGSYAWTQLPLHGACDVACNSPGYYGSLLQQDARVTLLLRTLENDNQSAFAALQRKALARIGQGLEEFEALLRYASAIERNAAAAAPRRAQPGVPG